jgi:hypothetical protein
MMTGNISTHWQHRYGLSCPEHFAIWRQGHSGDKAIALAIARLNETLHLPVIADGVAYSLETVFNRGIAHRLSRPYTFAQFLFRNHTVAFRQKISQRLEHFWPQSNRLASPAQEITLCVEEAIRKEVAHGLDLPALWCAHNAYDHMQGMQQS